MTTITDLQTSYRARLADPDPIARAVAQRQLARIDAAPRRIASTADTTDHRPSRWAHVPLADLFSAQGNHLYQRGTTYVETGHEPHHASKSGRCVLITTDTGRWWCRSCRRGGDAATYVMDVRGCTYPAAVAWLVDRFGRPGGATATREVQHAG